MKKIKSRNFEEVITKDGKYEFTTLTIRHPAKYGDNWVASLIGHIENSAADVSVGKIVTKEFFD